MPVPRRRRPLPSIPGTLEDLRPLLVAPEQGRIEQVEQQLEQHLADLVADVLPESVVKSREKGDALEWALEPLTRDSISEIVRKDPGSFADAIAPAMGSAIRKAVAIALRATLQRLNEALEHSLSPTAIRWRIEARRTGRPFVEVALVRSLVYRVEQVFLIHRGTGLLLQHLAADATAAEDPDQIAAMVSALERFTHEAFREDARLERFRVGELTGWVEHGPSAILVAIVRGIAPESYESALRQVLDRVHLDYVKKLAEFRGDAAPFAGASDILADSLRESRRRPKQSWLPLAAATLVLAAVGASFGALSSHRSRRFAEYTSALRREPGLVVTSEERHGGRYVFTGLRDPLTADPAAVLARGGLDPRRAALRFEPFYSLDPRLVERRVGALLKPPAAVSLALRGGTLEASGVAPKRWIDRARSLAATMPGVTAFAGERLATEESIELDDIARSLGAKEVPFAVGSSRLGDDVSTHLDGIAAEENRALQLADDADETVRIVVIGCADATGAQALNQELSLARAKRVVAALIARGVPPHDLEARGCDAEEAARTRAARFRMEHHAVTAG